MFSEKLTSSQFSLPYDTETKGIMNDKQETTEQSKVHEGSLKSGEGSVVRRTCFGSLI